MKRPERPETEGEDTEDEVAGTPEPAPDLEALTRERDEYLASWKRAAADYQNLRRRLQADLESAVARQKTGLLSDLLLVLDYLDMALATPVSSEEGKSLHAGVEATRTALVAVLEREGARPIPDSGTFDPAFHESVAQVASEDAEPGTIVEVVRRGYTLDGRVLRPAQVKVAGRAE